jgi:hypothetical protein
LHRPSLGNIDTSVVASRPTADIFAEQAGWVTQYSQYVGGRVTAYFWLFAKIDETDAVS